MILNKFQVGQRVFCASVGWDSKELVCPDCLGTREWTVSCPSGETFKHPCRTCFSGYRCTGTVLEYGDNARIDEYTIGSIRIDTADHDRPVSYMCVETGVGSGSVYDEKNIFPTRSDAELWTTSELERVKGLRQEQELKDRKRRKGDSLIFGKRAKKAGCQ